jgi:protein involved in polysaccharide export with SLBB domain
LFCSDNWFLYNIIDLCTPSVGFAGLSIPTLIQTFKELIIRNSRYTRPDANTILSAAKSYLMEMAVAVELNSGEQCVALYEKVKGLAKTYTRGIIQDKSHVVLNGPAFKDFPNILLGIDLVEKRRIMVKLLKVQEDTLSRTEQEKENAIKSEVEVCKYFRSLNVPGLVKCDVVEVKVDDAQGLSVSIGVWQAIKMHDYGSSLANLPQFPEVYAGLSGQFLTTVSSNTIATTADQSSVLSTGDLIRVYSVLTPENHEVFPVSSANSTAIVLFKPISNTNIVGDVAVDKLKYKNVAWNNIANDNVARYVTSSYTEFDTYNTMQIKVVLLSESTHIVPKVEQIQVIGTSA